MSAGEASGDQHGAAVARAIRARRPRVRLLGIGGGEMEAAGVTRIAGLDELSVMGGWEVVRRLPFLLRLQRRIERLFAEEEIGVFLPIDYPGLNLRLARAARGQGRPVLYFIAPQVWAWREGRARKLERCCDRVLTVLPFEADLLRKYGVRVDFVGHPLLDAGLAPEREGGPPSSDGKRLVGLFPGSRAQEVRHMLPVFAEAARRLARRYPDLQFRVARPGHLPEALYAEAGFPTAGAREVAAGATAALTKSGTITLELALAGVPMVVGYRTTRLEWAVGRRLVRVPSIVLVNLVAGAPIVPELLQARLTPASAVSALEPLLDEGSPARRAMLAGFEDMRERLGAPGCATRVAAHAIELLE
ncbi:lipid-A-disaccharide synthase [Candidatus Palauibacter sp.]|uniref:lipid-A-disaccharide synthase n=1 Tax=Candidatus Palauibacter sp. TaxID=3101350 RepID=UPI003AF249AC